MEQRITFTPKGICPQLIEVIVEDGKVKDLNFTGGCNGNLKGIVQLVKGKKTDEIICLLEGITCKNKSTSCPDQLAQALKEATN